MKRLAWNEFEPNDHTLQLIAALFETDSEVKKVRDDRNNVNRNRGGGHETRAQSKA